MTPMITTDQLEMPQHGDKGHEHAQVLASRLRAHRTVAVAAKHVPAIRKALTAAEDEITHYKPICCPGEDYESGLLTMEDIHD